MPNAVVRLTSNMQFVASADSGHAVVMDAGTESGGNNTGSRPMELLLMGIGGCSGMDIISILRKKRQQVTGLEAEVSGTMAAEHPHKYTAISIGYTVRGKGISEDAVKRAVELSMEKYCSVKATLEGSAEITHTFRIIED